MSSTQVRSETAVETPTARRLKSPARKPISRVRNLRESVDDDRSA